ncbi:MAG TPA: response regulator [Myxococcota bacterium]|nr:response regulator [Myxococcota bacterium]
MAKPRPRLLIVDDEEAILETMTFTFEDDYEVFTGTSASEGLAQLDKHAPIAVVISDQRMPEMTGVEFLARVFARSPATQRIILTGFADMDAIIRAINDGHVYAYITKPWEPDQLKQVVRRAADHHALTCENERLLGDLRTANVFLEGVMDQLDTGAVALDARGLVRAVNKPARQFLGVVGDARGKDLRDALPREVYERFASAVSCIRGDTEMSHADIDLPVGDGVRLRVKLHTLTDPQGGDLGQVILAREISHEPMRLRFDEILEGLANQSDGALRPRLAAAQAELGKLSQQLREKLVSAPGMGELRERTNRTLTAIEHWLTVDDALAREDFPDAQLLRERMLVAGARWPLGGRLPQRVKELAQRVETYYESGDNPKRAVL